MVQFAVEQGADEASLLAAAGLDPAHLDLLDGEVCGAAMSALWEAAADQTGDPDFGLHLGAQAQPGAISILGYLMLSANTLGDAMEALAHYSALLAMLRWARFDPGGPGRPAVFEMAPPTTGPLALSLRLPYEATMAFVRALADAVTGRRLPVLAVAFVHPRPGTGTAAHHALFGVTPTFDAPCYRLEFEASALRWPGRSASPALFASFRREADLALARLAPGARDRAVAAVETRLQGGIPLLAEVAADLAMSGRTLQRHLEDEGTTFLEVVDDVRQSLAVRRLSEEEMSIHEIAFLLGYSAPSAFHRAFKRWTGTTPAEYRARAPGRRPGSRSPRPARRA